MQLILKPLGKVQECIYMRRWWKVGTLVLTDTHFALVEGNEKYFVLTSRCVAVIPFNHKVVSSYVPVFLIHLINIVSTFMVYDVFDTVKNSKIY